MYCLWRTRWPREARTLVCHWRQASTQTQKILPQRKQRASRTRGPGRTRREHTRDGSVQHGGQSRRLGAAHGRKIYLYTHLIHNQVIYSLDARMHNTRALRQLPFNGKKSKVAALRKDHWRQLAVVTFPSGAQNIGRSVFSKLRELKRLHELSFDRKLLAPKEKPKPKVEQNYYERDYQRLLKKHDGKNVTARRVEMKRRRKVLNNQKPNVIADMALIFAKLNQGPNLKLTRTEMVLHELAKRIPRKKPQTQIATATPLEEGIVVDGAAAPEVTPPANTAQRSDIGLSGEGSGTEVVVHWAYPADAYYASSWSYNVLHDQLEIAYNNRSRKIRPFDIKRQNHIAQQQGVEQAAERLTRMKAHPILKRSVVQQEPKQSQQSEKQTAVQQEAEQPQRTKTQSKRTQKQSIVRVKPSPARTPEQKAANIARHQKLVQHFEQAFAEKQRVKRAQHEALLAQHRNAALERQISHAQLTESYRRSKEEAQIASV